VVGFGSTSVVSLAPGRLRLLALFRVPAGTIGFLILSTRICRRSAVANPDLPDVSRARDSATLLGLDPPVTRGEPLALGVVVQGFSLTRSRAVRRSPRRDATHAGRHSCVGCCSGGHRHCGPQNLLLIFSGMNLRVCAPAHSATHRPHRRHSDHHRRRAGLDWRQWRPAPTCFLLPVLCSTSCCAKHFAARDRVERSARYANRFKPRNCAAAGAMPDCSRAGAGSACSVVLIALAQDADAAAVTSIFQYRSSFLARRLIGLFDRGQIAGERQLTCRFDAPGPSPPLPRSGGGRLCSQKPFRRMTEGSYARIRLQNLHRRSATSNRGCATPRSTLEEGGPLSCCSGPPACARPLPCALIAASSYPKLGSHHSDGGRRHVAPATRARCSPLFQSCFALYGHIERGETSSFRSRTNA